MTWSSLKRRKQKTFESIELHRILSSAGLDPTSRAEFEELWPSDSDACLVEWTARRVPRCGRAGAHGFGHVPHDAEPLDAEGDGVLKEIVC